VIIYKVKMAVVGGSCLGWALWARLALGFITQAEIDAVFSQMFAQCLPYLLLPYLLKRKPRMKKFFSWFTLWAIAICAIVAFVAPQAAYAATDRFVITQPILAAEGLRNVADDKRKEAAGKIDLNNTNVRAFLDLPGMYPTLAGKLVQNGPYDSVEDILKIAGLSERQVETLSKYVDKFTVTDPSSALTEGGDQINNGIYR
jgi:photosystem II PsbU protein